MDQEKEKSPLKRIDFEAGRFEAGGKTYFIEGSLTIERYAHFQIYEKELAYGFTVKGIYDKLNDIKKLLDKTRFVDSAVYIVDLMRGISKLEEREPTILKICALYCNTEAEDRTIINQDMITQKIEDWKREGIDMRDFFDLACSSVNGLHELYQTVTRSISDQKGNAPAASL